MPKETKTHAFALNEPQLTLIGGSTSRRSSWRGLEEKERRNSAWK